MSSIPNFHQGVGYSGYRDLAEGCGHRYTAVFGAPLETGAPYNVPFTIDIGALDSAFRGSE